MDKTRKTIAEELFQEAVEENQEVKAEKVSLKTKLKVASKKVLPWAIAAGVGAGIVVYLNKKDIVDTNELVDEVTEFLE